MMFESTYFLGFSYLKKKLLPFWPKPIFRVVEMLVAAADSFLQRRSECVV